MDYLIAHPEYLMYPAIIAFAIFIVGLVIGTAIGKAVSIYKPEIEI